MKSYIMSMLRKGSSDEASKLLEIFVQYHGCFKYTEEFAFECFYFHIPYDHSYYDFFHNYEGKGEQNIKGTPIHWRVVCYDKLQIWLE